MKHQRLRHAAKNQKIHPKKRRVAEKNPNTERTLYLVNIILLCIVTLGALGAGALFTWRYLTLSSRVAGLEENVASLTKERDERYTKEQLDADVARAQENARVSERRAVMTQIQSSLESGNSTASMLRNLFSDDIVVASGGKYYFYPVLDKVPVNPYTSTDFRLDDAGFLQYQGADDTITVTNGIDVSASSGRIDWASVADDGISYAIVAAGSRDEDGLIRNDANFVTNMDEALSHHIAVGAYWILSAKDETEAQKEAEHFVSLLENYQDRIKMPVAVWLETPEAGTRLESLTQNDWTENVKIFCSIIERAGYRSVIYGSLASFVMQTDPGRLQNYDRWIAQNDSGLYFPYDFVMWQYSGSGTVKGIDSDVNFDALISRKAQ